MRYGEQRKNRLIMVAAKPPQQLIMGFQSGSEIKFASVANLFCISLRKPQRSHADP